MRRLRRIILFLLLGAVVNVLVAWACARWGSIPLGNGIGTKIAIEATPDAAAKELHFVASECEYVSYYQNTEETWAGVRREYTRWITCINPDYSPWEYSWMQWGWPCVSMQYEVAGEYPWPNQVPGWKGGWPLSNRDRSVLHSYGFLPGNAYPLVPLPLGFTLNTLFYAALLFLPFATFTTLRRRRRIRRNLCPSCGYSLTGAVPTNNIITCPECGIIREQTLTTT
jgi:hypothetical protein